MDRNTRVRLWDSWIYFRNFFLNIFSPVDYVPTTYNPISTIKNIMGRWTRPKMYW